VSANAGAHPGPGRLARASAELELRGFDMLLVTAAHDVRYLSGFTGSHGLLLLAAGDGARVAAHRLLTDFRYETQAAAQLPDGLAAEIVAGELTDAVAAMLAGTSGRLGFDESQLTVKTHRRLAELLGAGWELRPCNGVIAQLRAVKEPAEVRLIAAAAELADRALGGLLAEGIVGHSEREVAIELELRMRRLGAEAASFPTIVAAGAHAALPHAQPRELPIPRDVLVTIDWGAMHEGYCSDCTRTYATGEGISAQAREVYEVVLAAQEAGVAAVRAGPSGRALDAVARKVIERGGYGEQFGHGLGHGVGMEVHEGPRLSRTAGEEPLRAGNVVTVEPGVYLPGVLGVRIEDLLVVAEDAQEVLSSLPKALTVLG
jgi:Xaa-Pro aminopeptidase